MDSQPFRVEELLSHRSWLLALACQLTGNGADAEELVDEAFARVLARRPALRGRLGAYLGRMVHNLARTLQRDRGRHGKRLLELEARSLEQQEIDGDPVAASAGRLEMERVLLDALQGLREEHRVPLILHFTEGHDVPRIAVALGLKVDTTRKRIARGLEELRTILQQRLGRNWRDTVASAFGLPHLVRGASLATLGVAACVLVLAGIALLVLARPPAPAPSSLATDAGAAAPALDEGGFTATVAPALAGSLPDPARTEAAAAAAPGAGRGGELLVHGAIVDDSGSGVAGGFVLATCQRAARLDAVASDGSFVLRLDPAWSSEEVALVAVGPGIGEVVRDLGAELAQRSQLLLLQSGMLLEFALHDEETGAAVPGVWLRLAQGDRLALGRSDAAGLVRCWLAAGAYELGVDASGVGRYAVLGDAAPRLVHAARPGGAPLAVPLRPAPDRIRLQAVDETGAPLLLASARLARGAAQSVMPGTPLEPLPAAAGGVDVAHPAPAERAGVWFEAEGFLPAFALLAGGADQLREVRLARAMPASIRLLDATGAPAPGRILVEWTLHQPGPEQASWTRQSWTDAAGRIALAAPATPGEWLLDLRAVRGGHLLDRLVRIRFDALPGSRDWVWRVGLPGIEAEIALADPSGAPLAGWGVRAQVDGRDLDDFDSVRTARAATGADGLARLRLRAGGQVRWYLSPDASHVREWLAPAADVLPATGSFRRNFVLPTGSAHVAGRVSRADGSPAAGLEIHARIRDAVVSPGLEQATWTRTDDAGRFQLEGLPACAIQLDVQDHGQVLLEATAAPPFVDLELLLEPARTLLVRVLDPASGLPVQVPVFCRFEPTGGGPAQSASSRGGEWVVFDTAPLRDGYVSVSFRGGVLAARRVAAEESEVVLAAGPGRLDPVAVPVGYPGEALPPGVRCYLAGEELEDPRWRSRRLLDGQGALLLHHAPLGRFEVILRDENGRPLGDPIVVPE